MNPQGEFLDQVTPVILTFDEAPNIGRCLEHLAWAGDIVVVDSGSTDGTLAICAANPRVRVFSRPFDSHAQQWNFAVSQTGVASDWVLALDADYMVIPAVVEEMRRLSPASDLGGYWLSFRYAVMGQVLRSGIYPPVLALCRRQQLRYSQDGHTQRACVDGIEAHLKARALHDDRKPFGRWLRSQLAYAELETGKLEAGPCGLRDWLRSRTPLGPMVMAAYCLIWRGGLLEGPPGWYYALQRVIAEAMISTALLDRRLRGR